MKPLVRLSIALFTTFSALCSADVVYNVSLKTAPLIANINGPFALDFQLTSGNTTSGVVNAAALSQFQFGTGGSAGTGSPFSNSGNASGNFAATITLNTSGGTFFSEFSQYFKPGDTLTLQLDLTNDPQPTATPDEFTVQLIDSTGNEISTTDPSGSNSLLILDLTGSALNPLIYTTNGDDVSITPILETSATPEPGTVWLVCLAGAPLWAWRRRKRRVVL